MEGTLTDNDRIELITKLSNSGFKNIEVHALDVDLNELDDTSEIVRDTEDPDKAKLILIIRAYPEYTPFLFGKILGVSNDEDFYFLIKEEASSEKSEFN